MMTRAFVKCLGVLLCASTSSCGDSGGGSAGATTNPMTTVEPTATNPTTVTDGGVTDMGTATGTGEDSTAPGPMTTAPTTTDADGSSGGSTGEVCFGDDHCSADLHDVVDCHGDVVMTCPDDQGCSGLACVPACDAASDNKSTFGCDYYVVGPDILFDGAGACFAAFVVNTWSTPVSLTVDFEGQQLDASKFAYIPSGSGSAITYEPLPADGIPAGEVAILFLNRHGISPLGLVTDCPDGVTPAITTKDTAPHGTTFGSAFHIATSAPVVAYDIYPYGGGQSAFTSATLLLPTSAWDTNYIAVDAFGPGFFGGPFISIVAQEDGTEVTINPTADIVGKAPVAPTPKGTPGKYNLARGQALQFTQPTPLAGSVIQSNHPVGVWGGKTNLSIDACCDDSAHQQIPPVRALGSEYVAVRYRNRYEGMEEVPPWRIIGAADGTVLTYEPNTPPDAPTTLQLGEVTDFHWTGQFVVKSQDADHPFYMSAHMTGAAEYDPEQQMPPTGSADGRGDAEFVNIVPAAEYLDRYVFFTDPTYSETNLVVVRVKGPSGFADVDLDCAGTLGDWQPLGLAGKYEYTRVDLVRGDFEPQGACDNGRHEMKSKQPFGLTVWGWGSAETGVLGIGFYTQYVSYAYPAGAGVAPINNVVVPPQ